MDLKRFSNGLIPIQEVDFEEPVKDTAGVTLRNNPSSVSRQDSKTLEELIQEESKKRNSIHTRYIDHHMEDGISPLGSNDSIFDDINCSNCDELIKEIEAYHKAEDFKCQYCNDLIMDFDLFCFQNRVFFMFDKKVQHGYHLRCIECSKELESETIEDQEAQKIQKYYCIKCHDSLNVPVCNNCLKFTSSK